MAIDAPVHSNEANFNRVLSAGLPVLVVVWRRDCATCEQLNGALDRLEKAYSAKALVVKVNADDEAGLVRRLGVSELPGLVFFKDGQEAGRGAGAAAERDLAAWLDYLTGTGTRPAAPTGPTVPLGRSSGAAAGPSGPTPAQQPSRPAGTGVKSEPMILTDSNFDQVVRTSSVPVLVDFWAVWCGPCKMIAPHVSALAQEFAGRAVVGKLNVDENPRVAGQYGIMSIPTLLIFDGGRVVDQIVGVQPAQVLRQRLARHVK
jgi:thioredoxin 1